MQLPLEYTLPQPQLRPEVVAAPSQAAKLRLLLEGDLNFHGQKGEDPLHALHPFPAKFPPALPRLFIRHLTEPGDRVLDPMMGSGTTILEAHRLGRVALGTDIDPLALRLVAAKATPPAPALLESAFHAVLTCARQMLENPRSLAVLREARLDDPTRAFADYWFLPQTQQELLALSAAIEESPPAVQPFLRVVFSSTIIAKSGSVAQARDLSHTRPHKVEKAPRSAVEAFRAKARRALRLLAQMPPRPSVFPWLSEADAQRLPFNANSVHLIVTSPPYAANAIDYMRAHKFSLIWWGYSIRALGALRKEYIGGEALQGFEMEALPPAAMQAVGEVAAVDARKGKVLHRYFSEMRRVLNEMRRVLVPEGVAVLVVGESTMRGVPARVPQSLAAIGEQVGLRCVGIGERQLDRDRRMMPTRRGGIGSAIEKRMHSEYVLGFLKEGDAS